jgi:hypothetical protein
MEQERVMKIIFTLGSLIVLSVVCPAAEVDLGTHGILSFAVPESWTVNSNPANSADGSPVGFAFAFKPRSQANAKCLLSLAYVKGTKLDKERIRQEVLRITKEFASQSVEKKASLRDFSLKQGYGAYCLFTDASLVGKPSKRDDYKVMGSGQVQLSEEVVGVVSIFADDAEGPEFKAMLAIINSLELKSKRAN